MHTETRKQNARTTCRIGTNEKRHVALTSNTIKKANFYFSCTAYYRILTFPLHPGVLEQFQLSLLLLILSLFSNPIEFSFVVLQNSSCCPPSWLPYVFPEIHAALLYYWYYITMGGEGESHFHLRNDSNVPPSRPKL